MIKSLETWIAKLQSYINRPWYFPLLSGLVALDIFIGVVPSDGLFVSTILVHPKEWFKAAIWTAGGSAFGAFLLMFLVGWDVEWVKSFFPYLFNSTVWVSFEHWIIDYGSWATFLIALTPMPQAPVLVLAALSKVPVIDGSLAFFLGRVLKYILLGWIASHSPKLLNKLPIVKKELDEVEEAVHPPKKKH